MELEKPPVPLPLVVLLSDTVGLGEVLQQTPRAVTAAPPSEVTFPPLEAVVVPVAVVAPVVTVGMTAELFTLLLALSFPSFVSSGLDAVLVAVFVIAPVLSTVAVILRAAEASLAREPIFHRPVVEV